MVDLTTIGGRIPGKTAALPNSSLFLLDQHLRIDRRRTDGARVAACRFVEVGFVSLPAIRAFDDERFGFFWFGHRSLSV